jgi:alpha-amylase
MTSDLADIRTTFVTMGRRWWHAFADRHRLRRGRKFAPRHAAGARSGNHYLHRLALAALCIGAIGPAPGIAQVASNSDWQAQSIYQVITDRFYDGDPSNNNADGNFAPDRPTSVHGGDFKGLEQKLDYIKALGATAIWISPIVANGHGQFHGYAGRDFYHVDPHWGSLADLQHLIQAAHAKGLLVIDDVVCNHGDDLIASSDPGYGRFVNPPTGYRLEYRSDALTYPAPFDAYNSTYTYANNELTNLFHNQGCIGNFEEPSQVQLGELSGLDDFRTESPYVRSNMVAIYDHWIKAAGFDGFRVDTVKHVDAGFWQYWCPRMHTFAADECGKTNFFLFGEVYDGNEALCGSFTGTKAGGPFEFDSVLDYPLYFLARNVFGRATASASQIERHYANVAGHYDSQAQMSLVTFLDNHDQPRFLHSSTTNRLAVALVFLYTARGVPCLYYGTEQGFNGATDPYDREDMFAGRFKDAGMAGMDSFDMTHPLFLWVARLNNFRRLYPALSLGAETVLWSTKNGPGLFAYCRQAESQQVLVVLNTAGAAETLPPIRLTYPAGTVLANLFDSTETIRLDDRTETPAISVPSTSAKLFVAQPQVLPLDPVVAAAAPRHGAAGIAAGTPVVLHFSEPMDTNSVQGAFQMTPATEGTIGWSADHKVMTFTPQGAQPDAGETVVQVEDTACDRAGQRLHAPFELKFATAAGQ